MPTRATSSFIQRIQTTLHSRASDYVMYCAGHGADSDTIRNYLRSLDVFPSHFQEWASRLTRTEIALSIPSLPQLLPGFKLSGPPKTFSWTDSSYGAQDQDQLEGIDTAHLQAQPLPEVVSVVVTLALQHYMLSKVELAHDGTDSPGQATTLSTLLSASLLGGKRNP